MEIKMVRCPNGHYYNAALHESCPECSQEVGRTEPVSDSVIGTHGDRGRRHRGKDGG